MALLWGKYTSNCDRSCLPIWLQVCKVILIWENIVEVKGLPLSKLGSLIPAVPRRKKKVLGASCRELLPHPRWPLVTSLPWEFSSASIHVPQSPGNLHPKEYVISCYLEVCLFQHQRPLKVVWLGHVCGGHYLLCNVILSFYLVRVKDVLNGIARKLIERNSILKRWTQTSM